MPIPPPPPGPPPPPAPPAFSPPSGGGGAADPNGRNLLLQSIRQGTKLKKASTNDRSQPLVAANKNNGRSPGGGTSIGSGSSGGNNSSGGFGGSRPGPGPGPLGLGDLFAGGIPKLKPVGSSGVRGKVGSPSIRQEHSPSPASSSPSAHYREETHSINSYHNNSSNSINIDSRSGSGSNSPASIHMSFNNKPPPPPPPPSNLKPSISNTTTPEQVVERKPVNYGKPSLAPKPPGINGGVKSTKPNPPPKLPNLYIPPPPPLPSDTVDSRSETSNQMPHTPPSAGSSVNRAQSMRMPRTASPQTPNAASIEYRTMGRSAGREIAAMNASGQPPPPPRIIANGLGGARVRTPLRPPSARPPPPPNKAPPAVPPPPPPSSAPPPPRHRVSPAPTPPQLRVNGNLGPLPPVPAGGPPPPPPTRNSSMRSVNSATSITSASSGSGSSSPSIYTGVDLESRFGHLFPSLDELPPPGMFQGIVKTYPSKNGNAHSIKRQPAPQPPTQMQLGSKMWANNTSTC